MKTFTQFVAEAKKFQVVTHPASAVLRGAKIVHPKHGVGRVLGYARPGLYSVRYASGKEQLHPAKELSKHYEHEPKLEQLRNKDKYGSAKDEDIEKLHPGISMK